MLCAVCLLCACSGPFGRPRTPTAFRDRVVLVPKMGQRWARAHRCGRAPKWAHGRPTVGLNGGGGHGSRAPAPECGAGEALHLGGSHGADVAREAGRNTERPENPHTHTQVLREDQGCGGASPLDPSADFHRLVLSCRIPKGVWNVGVVHGLQSESGRGLEGTAPSRGPRVAPALSAPFGRLRPCHCGIECGWGERSSYDAGPGAVLRGAL